MKTEKSEKSVKKTKASGTLTAKSPKKAGAVVKPDRRTKVKKVPKNGVLAEELKKAAVDQGANITPRQQKWNEYLQVFREGEKLNDNQQEIVDFCLDKSLTPPRRKAKFLKFIRNCNNKQAGYTDDEINGLFDLLQLRHAHYNSQGLLKSTSDAVSSTDTGSNGDVTESKKKVRTKSEKLKIADKLEKSTAVKGEETDKKNLKKKKKTKKSPSVKMEVD